MVKKNFQDFTVTERCYEQLLRITLVTLHEVNRKNTSLSAGSKYMQIFIFKDTAKLPFRNFAPVYTPTTFMRGLVSSHTCWQWESLSFFIFIFPIEKSLFYFCSHLHSLAAADVRHPFTCSAAITLYTANCSHFLCPFFILGQSCFFLLFYIYYFKLMKLIF